MVFDITLEEARQAEGGYIKVDIKGVDHSKVTNPQLRVMGEKLNKNKELFIHTEDSHSLRISELEGHIADIKANKINSK